MQIEKTKGRHLAKNENDGVMGYITYKERGENTVEIDHTVVYEAYKGQGLASKLVRSVADEARKKGWKIIPTCSYAEAWFQKHDEEKDLL